MQKTTKHYIGVDIAKENFVADLPRGSRTYSQDKAGHARFIKALLQNAHVVCEATGGYEQALVGWLQAAGIAISVVMPARVRDYARSQGILAKNDRIDASVLSRYAAASTLRETQPPSATQRQLRELMHARDAIIEQLKIESCQREHISVIALLVAQAAERKALLEAQLVQIEEAMEILVASDPQLKESTQRCCAVQGVGKVTMWTVLCEMPELGTLEKGQASCLLGVAPICKDSGNFKRQRHINAGRAQARRVFYMAAISAARHNPILSVFYQRLIGRGKPPKLALVAVMRKLAELLNLVLKYPNFSLAR